MSTNFGLNIKIFEDTANRISSTPALVAENQRLDQSTRLYQPGFQTINPVSHHNTQIQFTDNTVLTVVRSLANTHVGILNFADAVRVGGHVQSGEDGQEEYLCRATNLIYSLLSKNAYGFYARHRRIADLNSSRDRDAILATDTVIYSPRVVIIKQDDPSSGLVYTENWTKVDVISCAAPRYRYLDTTIVDELYIPTLGDGDLEWILEQRIANMMEVAIDNYVESLVIGTPEPDITTLPTKLFAESIGQLLQNDRYAHAFRDIVFVISDEVGLREFKLGLEGRQ